MRVYISVEEIETGDVDAAIDVISHVIDQYIRGREDDTNCQCFEYTDDSITVTIS